MRHSNAREVASTAPVRLGFRQRRIEAQDALKFVRSQPIRCVIGVKLLLIVVQDCQKSHWKLAAQEVLRAPKKWLNQLEHSLQRIMCSRRNLY